ncbi:ABC transporter permease [Treponema sp. TIM-1]|uniref:ABC transporter permease n=1 Tax=Treponema sp. TIM-1 TaxID=2898417 RepID=UPI00397EB175
MKGIGKFIKRFFIMQESGVLILTVLFIIIVATRNKVFLSQANILNVLRASGFTLITTIGMTLVLIAGGLDLSVGSVLCLGGVTCAMALEAGLPVFLCILIGIVTGALVGIFNAIVVVKIGIPPLMVTLGTQYVARGFCIGLTKGVPIFPLPQAFQNIEQQNMIWKIPNIVIIALVLSVIAFVAMKYTSFGRNVYAVGGNAEAARISGVNINKVYYSVYIIIGALAGLTGVLMASRLGSGQATAGTGYELTVIAAAVIGGTSTFGGIGSVAGSVLGALFMQIMGNSLTVMKIDVYWQNVAIGMILLLAVIMDQYRRTTLLRSGV